MKAGGHIACRVGDNSGRPPRDVASDRTPVTIFREDGTVLSVIDLDDRLLRAARKLARRERVCVDRLLSASVVRGLEKLIKGKEEA